MAVALLGLLLGAVPVIVLPGVLSTFEPVKTLLVDAIAVLACLGAPVLRLIPGVSSPDGGPGLFDRILAMDWVRQVTIAGVTASAVIALLSTLFSVAPDTSWFGTLGRGQGTIFMIALGAILILTTGDLRWPGTSALLVRILAIGALPVAISTVLQRFGIDPVSLTLCGVERVPTTIGNALPGATYLSVATLVALELARQAWLRRDDDDAGPAPSAVPATGPRRETARRRRRTVGAFGVTDTPVVRPGWQRPVAEASGALALLYGGMWAVRDDLSTTWLPIPLALVWGASVVRAVGLRPVVRWNVAFAGWLALAALLLIGNGITLSRGPAAGLVLGLGIWIIALFTGAKPGTRLSSVAIPVALAVAGTLVMVGAWFTPSTVCLATPGSRTAGVSAPAPLPAASGGGVATSAAEAKQPAASTAPVTPPAPVAPSISDQTLSVVSSRVNIFTDPRVWSSVSWRTNIWEQSLVVYMDRPAPSAPRARSMAAALAGAQFGDVSRLNGLPDHRPAGSWWYRLFGYGPESQVFVLASNDSPLVAKVQGDITYDRAHNSVLDVLLTTGAVGLVAWMVTVIGAMAVAWGLRRTVTAGFAGPALAPALVCLAISGLTGVDATAITFLAWTITTVALVTDPSDRVPRAAGPVERRPAQAVPVGVLDFDGAQSGWRPAMIVGGLGVLVIATAIWGPGAGELVTWVVGALAGMAMVGVVVAYGVADRPVPDWRVLGVLTVAGVLTVIVMVPAWNALVAGYYVRVTQNPGLARDVATTMLKKATTLDPGQATYRVLSGNG
ncbi:MAG: hypothetical protein EB058_14065 [Proteobacteria bacterium]|nr:hypothetical protein [Pseudomonadota bacterium]